MPGIGGGMEILECNLHDICRSCAFPFLKFRYISTRFIQRGTEWSENRYTHSSELMLVFSLQKEVSRSLLGLAKWKTGLVSRNILRAVFVSQREPRSCFPRRTSPAVRQQWHLQLPSDNSWIFPNLSIFLSLASHRTPPPPVEIALTKPYRLDVEADDLFFLS